MDPIKTDEMKKADDLASKKADDVAGRQQAEAKQAEADTRKADADADAQAKKDARATGTLASKAEADAEAFRLFSAAAEAERETHRAEVHRLGNAADAIRLATDAAERMADARARYVGWSAEDALAVEAAASRPFADADFDVAAVRRHYAPPVEEATSASPLKAEDVMRHYQDGGQPVTKVVGKPPKAQG